MPDEYIRRAEALEITTRTCGDYAAAFAERVSEACMAPVMRVSRLLDKLQKVPAADVAEVVRCKDCAKHYIVLGRDMCARNAQGSEGHWIGLSATVPDGFCHRGVHK